ncbi:MAG: hypothetical protein ABFS56_33800 [Pseudomonadota bacterium]
MFYSINTVQAEEPMTFFFKTYQFHIDLKAELSHQATITKSSVSLWAFLAFSTQYKQRTHMASFKFDIFDRIRYGILI